ncbi:hypothetical protein D3C72_1436170 [compost metagenome]
MAGQHVSRGIGQRLVPQQERPQACVVMHLYLQRRLRQIAVVIAAYHVDVQRSMLLAPTKPLLVPGRAMRRAMQDVAEDP